MSHLRWSVPARADLRRIRSFLEPRDPDAAAHVIGAIIDRVEQLRNFPFSGPPLEIAASRKLTVGGFPYVILYAVTDRVVTILRVHHAAEDWQA